MASCPRLRTQRSFCRRAIHQCGDIRCRRAIHPCDHDKTTGGQFFPATTIKQQAEPFNFAATALRRRNCNTLRRRKLESDAAPLRQILLQASYSTCRHDGTAVIPDFSPRIGNRCSNEAHFGDIRAAILDFRPRIDNHCRHGAHSGDFRAAIPDLRGSI